MPSKNLRSPTRSAGAGASSSLPAITRAVGAANLEDHRIDVIEHQRFLRLHQQVEVRAVVADADVLGHVQRGIQQRAIVR